MHFVRQLLQADFVISASLHGIVLAEAYGIPAIYFNSKNSETLFKYNDYYHGTGRTKFHTGHSIEECLDLGGNSLFDIQTIQKNLMNSFPIELWTK